MKKLTNLQIMVKKVFCCFLCLLITLPGITATQVQHPWQGKRVAYLGDSITDPKNKAAKNTIGRICKKCLASRLMFMLLVEDNGMIFQDKPNN